jgi:hypothetical protein
MKAEKSITITIPADLAESIERLRVIDCSKYLRFRDEADIVFSAGRRAIKNGWECLRFDAEDPFFSGLPEDFVPGPRRFTPYDAFEEITGDLKESQKRLLQILILGVSRRVWELKLIAEDDHSFHYFLHPDHLDEAVAAGEVGVMVEESIVETLSWHAGVLPADTPTLDDHAELIE